MGFAVLQAILGAPVLNHDMRKAPVLKKVYVSTTDMWQNN